MPRLVGHAMCVHREGLGSQCTSVFFFFFPLSQPRQLILCFILSQPRLSYIKSTDVAGSEGAFYASRDSTLVSLIP